MPPRRSHNPALAVMSAVPTRAMGVDLSLSCSGLAYRDISEPLRWPDVAVLTCGESLPIDAPERDRIARLQRLSGEILSFAELHRVQVAVFEQYAFSRQGAQARAIAELGGATKCALAAAGIEVVTVPASSARKTLLGKCPRKDAKKVVQFALKDCGCPFWEQADVCDAFTVLNHYASTHGGNAIMLAAEAA